MEITIHETGSIHVKEIKNGKVWRCAIGAGNTNYANKILGAEAQDAMMLAGEKHGGWDKLETKRNQKKAITDNKSLAEKNAALAAKQAEEQALNDRIAAEVAKQLAAV